MGFVNQFHIRPVMTCLWSKLQAQGTAEIRRVCPEWYTIYTFYIYIYVYIIPIWGWVKTYYYNIWGNKHLLTSYLRLFKGIWLITIMPGHGTSHDQSAWLAPFTRFAGPGPKGLPERRIAAIITILVGGWATPLKNMKVSWDDDIPIYGKMFQTTNQMMVCWTYDEH